MVWEYSSDEKWYDYHFLIIEIYLNRHIQFGHSRFLSFVSLFGNCISENIPVQSSHYVK